MDTEARTPRIRGTARTKIMSAEEFIDIEPVKNSKSRRCSEHGTAREILRGS